MINASSILFKLKIEYKRILLAQNLRGIHLNSKVLRDERSWVFVQSVFVPCVFLYLAFFLKTVFHLVFLPEMRLRSLKRHFSFFLPVSPNVFSYIRFSGSLGRLTTLSISSVKTFINGASITNTSFEDCRGSSN